MTKSYGNEPDHHAGKPEFNPFDSFSPNTGNWMPVGESEIGKTFLLVEIVAEHIRRGPGSRDGVR